MHVIRAEMLAFRKTLTRHGNSLVPRRTNMSDDVLLIEQEDADEPLETLYIEEDELVLPNQAEAYINVATQLLEERNSRRKKRKIRNFPQYPVSQWQMPIRYKIDNTFSKLFTYTSSYQFHSIS